MKVVLEKLGSPYPARRLVKVVYEYTIGKDEYVYSVAELLKVGAAVQSLRDTTSHLEVYLENGDCVIETPKYRIVFGKHDLMCLEPDLQDPFFNILRKILGFTAALGFVAVVYDKVKEVERKSEKEKVKFRSCLVFLPRSFPRPRLLNQTLPKLSTYLSFRICEP